MEEQRIKNLEEEFKVLKNQIKAVLLDIKEQLAAGGGASSWGSISAATSKEDNIVKAVAEPPSAGPGPGPEENGASAGPTEMPGAGPAEMDGLAEMPGAGSADMAGPTEMPRADSDPEMNRSGLPRVAVRNTDSEGQVDLLTISVLSQWLTRAAASVSKTQICKMVEIYDITGNLTPKMKQAILLLADLHSNGNHAGDDEVIPAAESVQLLIELDSLLRYRTGVLEPVVLSMLLDKGQKNRRGG